jgi:hypothetical protein
MNEALEIAILKVTKESIEISRSNSKVKRSFDTSSKQTSARAGCFSLQPRNLRRCPRFNST